MLRNKYVLAIVGVLFLTVATYNYSFFRAQAAKKAAHGTGQARHSASDPSGRLASSPGTTSEYHPVWRRDPFWYPDGVDHSIHRAYRPSHAGIVLEGTMVEGGKGFAIINGEIVGVGDHVQDAVIMDIKEQSITVKDSKGTRTISIVSETIEKEN